MHIIEKLKTTPRTGWLNENVNNPESIADHMYRMSLITMFCSDTTMDKTHAMKIALVHDLAEAIVGDITPLDNIPKEKKSKMELDAMVEICERILPPTMQMVGADIMKLFLEYENKSSAEARFVKDVDKYELVLQTFEYEKAGKTQGRLDHFAASSQQITSPEVKGWVEDVLQAREAWWAQQAASK